MAPVAGNDRLQQLLDAVMSLGAELDLESTLHRIVAAATELTCATYGAFGVLDDSGSRLEDLITVGMDDEEVEAIGAFPTGRGVLRTLIDHPVPLRIRDLSEHPDSIGVPRKHPTLTSFLGLPVWVRDKVYGYLYLANRKGSTEFDLTDERVAVSLATAAGTAIENARMHDRFAQLVVVEDRERIARELHDVVIQRIYGVGLNLQRSIRMTDDPELAARLESAVDDLDDTIRDIRTTIFGLQPPLSNDSLRQAVRHLVEESGRALGFQPTVRFHGPVDSAVSVATAGHMLVVIREALSNVARHAHATTASVDISAEGDVVLLTVHDDGVGPGDAVEAVAAAAGGAAQGEGLPGDGAPVDGAPGDDASDASVRGGGSAGNGPTAGRGLANIRARAEELGGSSSFGAGPGGGSMLRWTVPLDWL